MLEVKHRNGPSKLQCNQNLHRLLRLFRNAKIYTLSIDLAMALLSYHREKNLMRFTARTQIPQRKKQSEFHFNFQI